MLRTARDMSGFPDSIVVRSTLPLSNTRYSRLTRALPPKVWCSGRVIGTVVGFIDFAVILICSAVLLQLSSISGSPDVDRYDLLSVIAAAGFAGGMRFRGAYAVRQLPRFHKQVSAVVPTWCGVFLSLVVAGYALKMSSDYSRAWMFLWFAVTPGAIVAVRALVGIPIWHLARRGYLASNIVIVGVTGSSERLLDNIARNPDRGEHVLGIFDDRHTRIAKEISGYRVLGTTDDLVDFVRNTQVDEIIIALPHTATARLAEILNKMKMLAADIRICMEPVADTMSIRGVTTRGGTTLLKLVERPMKDWRGVAKWAEDVLIAAAALLIFSPVLLLIAIWIKLDSAGPVLFVQERFGYNNTTIRVFKFRTMRADRQDVTGAKRTVLNDDRITAAGYYLRKYSLDELPQLINVLLGDMSIVGPRPHALEMRIGDHYYHEAVSDYLSRHRIKPGLTGWAQINGLRGEINSLYKGKKRVEFDIDYIENWSILFDLYIIYRSLFVVVSGKNAY